ncbi:A24 family peptidase [Delftia sp. NA_296.1]|jgi:prepilin peptidase CpaA|uniref:Prepilin peptidase n=1 Tax=Delftia acidovorans TaxID=80866 RepID=A0AAJ2VAA6_DELAC|nr:MULTISPECIES: prepilin peptidase [Delftia]AEF91592.1 peptidase A24A prepilin type IV [Delftia sp. Cs1-4]ATH14149.1 peptidase A24 [Delftia acidovorans]MBK0115594.1 prepilin peptidase [Delftia sp. S65]MBK0121351.1 prepilin peptidase [Delftia sp. S67]MBK0133053.1 prepilin peptidase [Delftia sp. S66]
MEWASLWLCVCITWLATIAVMDLRIRRVRNWMVLLGLATGAAALASGAQPFQVSAWNALAGLLAGFVVLLPFYALRWMGAGDVKFGAVAGLWFGLSFDLLLIWTGGSLLAGLHGLLVLSLRHLSHSPTGLWLQARLPLAWAARLAPLGAASQPAGATDGPRQPQRSIPYAGYMAIAAIALAWRHSQPLA